MNPRAWALIGLGAFLLGGGLLWFGYSEDVLAQRNRREFIQGPLSEAANVAGDSARFRRALREVLRELEADETGLSEDVKLDGRFTLLSLTEDASSIDSTAARIELLRLVSRIDAAESPPERWVGRAGLVFLGAGLCMLGTAASRRLGRNELRRIP